MRSRKKLNLYGDRLITTQTGFGADIASQRLDDLDQKVVKHVRKLSKSISCPKVLEIGCGRGGLTVAMAQAGARVTAVDREDYGEIIEINALPLRVHQKIIFCKGLFEKLPKFSEAPFEMMVSQRTIHYLSFDTARKALRNARRQLSKDAFLFISASGLDSELGKGYADKDEEIKSRFASLSKNMSQHHAIYGCVCLYREEDMCQLLILSGFQPVEIFRSSFGNIKAIAQKCLL